MPTMQDHELYRRILGIEAPWFVDSVDLKLERHRITNASSESINAKIQWVKYTARGFRNKTSFVHAIYFHCGGLDLAPESTK